MRQSLSDSDNPSIKDYFEDPDPESNQEFLTGKK
jgi:hypothetical protein